MVCIACEAQHRAKHQMPGWEGNRLTLWNARRRASVRGARVPLLLKHGAQVLDRAHGCDGGASTQRRLMSVSVEDVELAEVLRQPWKTGEVVELVARVWSSFRPRVGVRAPFGRFCGRRVAAPSFAQTRDSQWKWDLCGLHPDLWSFKQRVGCATKDRFATTGAEGREGREGDRRGCWAFVVPPYKNARCLKLEETIRGWARRRGLRWAVGCCCGALPGDPDPIVRAILDEAGCAVMQQRPWTQTMEM